MQFYNPTNRNRFNDLKRSTSTLDIPFNAGRRVAYKRTQGMPLFKNNPPANQITIVDYINSKISTGEIDITPSAGAVVTVDGTQTITGDKTFSGAFTISGTTMDITNVTTIDAAGIPGTYADDPTAAGAGVDVGELYVRTTGEVARRLA